MTINYYHVDAFTQDAFKGNPAVVVPLTSRELFDSEAALQKLAAEFNMPATTFYLQLADSSSTHIKWFSPLKRLPICGHGSLAASQVIFESGFEGSSIKFDAGTAGYLIALRGEDGSITLDFPAPKLVDLTEAGKTPKQGVDLRAVLTAALPEDAHFTIAGRGDRGGYADSVVVRIQDDYPLKDMKYDASCLQTLWPEIRGFVFTTRSVKDPHFDIHSRCIYTSADIGEDSVTGSAHCLIGPYWIDRLELDPDTEELNAAQVSERGGSMSISWKKEEMRCLLRSTAVVLGKGEWNVDLWNVAYESALGSLWERA